MNKGRMKALALLGQVFLVMMAPLFGRAVMAAPAEAAQAVAQSNTAFALDLYGRERAGSGNLFFSPYSISSALAMTWAGAANETKKEIARVFHFGADPERVHAGFRELNSRLTALATGGKVNLNVANSLWCERTYPFKEDFLKLNRDYYQARISSVDFAGNAEGARLEINSWVAQQTQDKIKDLLQPGQLDALSTLVLCNAIYFKGKWTSPFEPRHTGPAPFHTPSGEIQTMLMRQQVAVKSRDIPDAVLFSLPYADGSLSMVIALPEAKDGLGTLEKNLNAKNLQQWLVDLDKAKETKAVVLLPKFKLDCRLELARTLSQMGMPGACTSKADFSGISTRRDLFISAVSHQAFVEVNEEGTEAAAATAVTMKRTSVDINLRTFNVDHPFVFFIRDNQSGNILFLGRVLSPK